jgi:hypothetical protein
LVAVVVALVRLVETQPLQLAVMAVLVQHHQFLVLQLHTLAVAVAGQTQQVLAQAVLGAVVMVLMVGQALNLRVYQAQPIQAVAAVVALIGVAQVLLKHLVALAL